MGGFFCHGFFFLVFLVFFGFLMFPDGPPGGAGGGEGMAVTSKTDLFHFYFFLNQTTRRALFYSFGGASLFELLVIYLHACILYSMFSLQSCLVLWSVHTHTHTPLLVMYVYTAV